MEKIKLSNGEKVNLFVTTRNIMEFEKKFQGTNLIKVLNTFEGAPNFTTIVQLIYVGYLGGANKSDYTFDEFVELVEFDIDELCTLFSKIAHGRKNVNSKKK